MATYSLNIPFGESILSIDYFYDQPEPSLGIPDSIEPLAFTIKGDAFEVFEDFAKTSIGMKPATVEVIEWLTGLIIERLNKERPE